MVGWSLGTETEREKHERNAMKVALNIHFNGASKFLPNSLLPRRGGNIRMKIETMELEGGQIYG